MRMGKLKTEAERIASHKARLGNTKVPAMGTGRGKGVGRGLGRRITK